MQDLFVSLGALYKLIINNYFRLFLICQISITKIDVSIYAEDSGTGLLSLVYHSCFLLYDSQNIKKLIAESVSKIVFYFLNPARVDSL